MEFKFAVNDVFKQPIVKIGSNLLPPGFTGDRRAFWDVVGKVSEVVNAMGEASAAAQGLSKPITTAERLRNSEHNVYLLIDQSAGNGRGAVTGMLKTGKKGLYVFDRNGQHFQVSPACVLDFYVHESRQRTGLGKRLFEHMLQSESIEPVQMAIDRPSEKFLGFLNKHYNLNNPVKQMNNYVVFDGFFPNNQEKNGALELSHSVSTVGKKQSANGLQTTSFTPLGRYGAPRPPCSMGQIIHNQTSTIPKNTEPTGVDGVRSAPETNYQNATPSSPNVSQSTPNMYYRYDGLGQNQQNEEQQQQNSGNTNMGDPGAQYQQYQMNVTQPVPSEMVQNTAYYNPEGYVPQNVQGNMQNNVPQNIQNNMPQNTQNNMPQNIQNNMPQNMPQNTQGSMAMQNNMPQNMTMQSNMPDVTGTMSMQNNMPPNMIDTTMPQNLQAVMPVQNNMPVIPPDVQPTMPMQDYNAQNMQGVMHMQTSVPQNVQGVMPMQNMQYYSQVPPQNAQPVQYYPQYHPTQEIQPTQQVFHTQEMPMQNLQQYVPQNQNNFVTPQPVPQRIHQPVLQPVTQTVRQPVPHVSQAVTQPVPHVSQSMSQAVTQPVSHVSQSMSQAVTQPVSQMLLQSKSPSASQPALRNGTQSVSQPAVTQSIPQMVTQPVSQVSQPIPQTNVYQQSQYQPTYQNVEQSQPNTGYGNMRPQANIYTLPSSQYYNAPQNTQYAQAYHNMPPQYVNQPQMMMPQANEGVPPPHEAQNATEIPQPNTDASQPNTNPSQTPNLRNQRAIQNRTSPGFPLYIEGDRLNAKERKEVRTPDAKGDMGNAQNEDVGIRYGYPPQVHDTVKRVAPAVKSVESTAIISVNGH